MNGAIIVICNGMALRMRELIRKIYRKSDVENLAGHVGKDHIHLLNSTTPSVSAKLVQYVKRIRPRNYSWSIRN